MVVLEPINKVVFFFSIELWESVIDENNYILFFQPTTVK